MPSFNIESILSELDSLPSMPNAVNVQSSPSQNNNNNLKSGDDRDQSYNKDDTKSIPSKRMIIFDVCIIMISISCIYYPLFVFKILNK